MVEREQHHWPAPPVTDIDELPSPDRAVDNGEVAQAVDGSSADNESELSHELPVDEYGRPPRVFISYRNDDCAGVARRLAAQLRRDLSSEVFYDKNPLPLVAGDDWRERLVEEIRQSDVFVCLIGARWPGYFTPEGAPLVEPRISATDDMVRAEVEAALEHDDHPRVVSILVDLDATAQQQLRQAASGLYERLVKLHRIEATSREIRRRRSHPYQTLLVAAWVALKDRIPDSILIVGERKEMAELDEMVDELREGGRIDPKQFRRFHSAAYVVRRKVSKRRFAVLRKDLPDAIIAVSPDEPTDEMKARVMAVVTHPAIKKVAFVGVGSLTVGAATALTQQASVWAAGSGTTVTTSGSATALTALPAATGLGSLTVAGKAVAAVALVAGAGGTAAAVDEILPDPPDPVESVELEVDGQYRLAASRGDDRAYPLGDPPSVDVRFGPEQLEEGESGGWDVIRRDVTVEAFGEVNDLGQITYPARWSDVADSADLEGGWNSLGFASADLTVPIAGTSAPDFCYDRSNTANVVAGFEFVDEDVAFDVAVQAETGVDEDSFGDLLDVRVVVWMTGAVERRAIDEDWVFDSATSECPVAFESSTQWVSG